MRKKALWFIAIAFVVTTTGVFASNPTVTVTKTDLGARANMYSISFSTNISLADTAFVFNNASTWFAIDGVCAHQFDDRITIECYSALTSGSTTADSIHFAIIYQVSSAASPTVTAGNFPNSGWITVKVDSVTLNGKTPGSNPGISTFQKVRYAGQTTKMRIVVAEIQTGAYTAKDANQTVTLRMLIPKRGY